VAPVGSFGSVSGCGVLGWCDGAVTGPVENQVQSQLQSTIASQFAAALNGQDNSSPFWIGFMNAVANQTVLPLLIDPAGNPLPLINQATPGGTATSWNSIGGYGYSGGKMTAHFVSSAGLCYIDCTPKPQAQLCGANSCGTIDDGCADTVSCPGMCKPNQICTNNQCKVCVPLTCADVGTRCGPIESGCGGNIITCNTCGDGMACQNGQCVGFGGQGGVFCQNCRNTGGTCSVGAGGREVCIHQ
jgi:hypothetical protein